MHAMRRALVVGIDDYPGGQDLSGCVNDAKTIAGLLKRHGDGSPNFDVRLITCPHTAVTRPVLREAIDQLFAGTPDMAVFFFAGHGFVSNKGGFLRTVDARRYDEGVSMDEVLLAANESDARNKVVILDCCHAGAMGSPALNGSNRAQLSDGLSVLAASSAHEAAQETNHAGVFSSLLADALNGGAADLRGNITPGAVYAYVDEALGAWGQRPMFKTNVSGLSTLRVVKPPVPLEVLRRITTHFETPNADFPLIPAHEFTHPSAEPDKVAVFKELQKMQAVGLVVPVGAEYMYFAAIESRSCKLTAMGHQYWRLAKEERL